MTREQVVKEVYRGRHEVTPFHSGKPTDESAIIRDLYHLNKAIQELRSEFLSQPRIAPEGFRLEVEVLAVLAYEVDS